MRRGIPGPRALGAWRYRAGVAHDRDVLFDGSGPDVSEENLRPLRDAVLAKKAAVGLATDGDADRFGILDSDGTWMQPNHILALLYDYIVETRGWKMPAARSVATSHLMDAVAAYYGTTVYQTPVGFKYIGELIQQDKIAMGGEESAGLTIRGHVPEKDGILACLLVAEMIAVRGASLAEQLRALFKKVGSEFWPLRTNLHLPDDVKQRAVARLKTDFKTFIGRPVTNLDRTDGLKMTFGDGSWVLVAAFRHRAADACLYGSLDSCGCSTDGKRNSRMGDGHSRRSQSLMRIPKITLPEAVAYARRNARQILLLALLALAIHDVFGPHGFIAMRRTQKEIEQVRDQIGKLNEENKSLSDQVTSLKTDPKAIERIAREEMGLARPGEVIYTLPDSTLRGMRNGLPSRNSPQFRRKPRTLPTFLRTIPMVEDTFRCGRIGFCSAGVPPVVSRVVKVHKITGGTPALQKPIPKPSLNCVTSAEKHVVRNAG